MGSTPESMRKAIDKYQEKFDLIRFHVPKGMKKEIDSYAKSHDGSITKFLNRIIDEEMKRNPF